MNPIAQLAIFRHTDFISHAGDENAFYLLYGMLWRTHSNQLLSATDLVNEPAFFEQGLDGQYTILKWNKATAKLTVQTDYLGTRSLYYYNHEENFILAQEASVLRSLLPERTPVNRSAFIASLASVQPVPSTALPTLLNNVYRVGGNCTLEFSQNKLNQLRTNVDVRLDVTSHIESQAQTNSQNLLEQLRETIHQVIARVCHTEQACSVDLSGGLDSGVLLGTLLALNNPPQSINSLVSQGFLDIEKGNIEQWKSLVSTGINMIEMLPVSSSIIEGIEQHQFLDVPGAGIHHINELVQAAASSTTKVRLIGFGPDEFMTNPLHTVNLGLLTKGILQREQRPHFKSQVYRLISHSTLPKSIKGVLTRQTVSPWYSDSTKRRIVEQKMSMYDYQKSINYLSPTGNRQFKIEFYQNRTLQLALNDEYSIKEGIFCYYPFLDSRILSITHALAVRRTLSNATDSKHAFRSLMANLLPEYLKSHTAQNENFTQFNNELSQHFLSNRHNQQKLQLVEQGYVDKNTFEKHLSNKMIPSKQLAMLYMHEDFLRTL